MRMHTRARTHIVLHVQASLDEMNQRLNHPALSMPPFETLNLSSFPSGKQTRAPSTTSAAKAQQMNESGNQSLWPDPLSTTDLDASRQRVGYNFGEQIRDMQPLSAHNRSRHVGNSTDTWPHMLSSAACGRGKLSCEVVLDADYDVLVPKSQGLQNALKQRIAAAIVDAAQIARSRVLVDSLARGQGHVIAHAVIDHSEAAEPEDEARRVMEALQVAVSKRAGALVHVFCASSVRLTAASGVQHQPTTRKGALSTEHLTSPPMAAAPGTYLRGRVGADIENNGDNAGRQESTGGILEVFVMQARALPTQEWTKAFCTLEIEKGSFSAAKASLHSTSIVKNIHAMTLGASEYGNASLHHTGDGHDSLDALAGRGHVHRTCVQGGTGQPKWGQGFQFGITKPSGSDRLRLQMLNKAAIGNEFIGSVTLEVRTIIERLEAQEGGTQNETREHRQVGETDVTGRRSLRADLAPLPWGAGTDAVHGGSMGVSKSKVGGGGLGGRWELIELSEVESGQHQARKVRSAWGVWMPLRNVVGERTRGPSGGHSEVLLGLQWTSPAPPDLCRIQGLLYEPVCLDPLKWTSGRFVLDGPEQVFEHTFRHTFESRYAHIYVKEFTHVWHVPVDAFKHLRLRARLTQVLWMREAGGGIGRKTNIRRAAVVDESCSIAPHVFSVTTAAGVKFIARSDLHHFSLKFSDVCACMRVCSVAYMHTYTFTCAYVPAGRSMLLITIAG